MGKFLRLLLAFFFALMFDLLDKLLAAAKEWWQNMKPADLRRRSASW